MTLENFKQQLELNKLYKVSLAYHSATDQIQPNLFVNSGSVNIYGYNGEAEPDYLEDMVLQSTSTNISGITPFCLIPSYIAITQNTGTSTEIIASGLNVTLIGNIGAST